MTTDVTHIRGYEQAIENLPPEAFLGELLWFTITAADVNLGAARTELQNLGLNDALLRKGLRPVDAFRKAAKEIEHKFKPSGDQRAEFLVRSVGEDQAEAHRHVMLERAEYKTGKRRRIVYEKVAELKFIRGSKNRKTGEYTGHSVQFRRTYATKDGTVLVHMQPHEHAWLETALTGLENRYHHLLHHMDSHAVRYFMRDYIAYLQGVLVKESGGLYFVGQEHSDEVARLGQWVTSIGSQFHSLPLLNLEDQRQMVLEALEDETVKEVSRLTGEIGAILGDPNRQITDKTFEAYGGRAAELAERLNSYSSNLGERAERATFELQVFSQQLLALAPRIKAAS